MKNSKSVEIQHSRLHVHERIRYCLDENVDNRIMDSVRKHGIEITTARDMALLGEKEDVRYLTKSTEISFVFVTGDQDLGAINKQWLEEGEHHAGILFITSARPRSPGELVVSQESDAG
jgi:hypothetical protein